LHTSIVANNYQVAIFKTSVKYTNGDGPDRGIPLINNRGDGVQYVWNNGCQLNSVCIHKDISKEILFPEAFFWFEDIYWAINVVLEYPLVLIPHSTCTYTSNDTSGLLNDNYRKYDENCVACMRHLETIKGDELKAILGKNCFDIKVSEHYLGFVVAGSVKTKKLGLGYSYLLKAMRTCLTPKLLMKYGYYFLKLLKASI
jgi:hypothetical protein